jgi:DNA repair exonuclease SbcCD ATPase subunit
MSDAAGNQIVSDSQGVLVGVQPAQPQTSNFQQLRPDQAVSQPVQVVDQANGNGNGARFTAEQLEEARRQEKEKLYPRLEELGSQLKTLQEERQAELAARQAEIDERDAQLRAKEESEMEIRDLLAKREGEFRSQIDEINQRYETDRAVFERERALQEAAQYRLARIEQESEFIFPELRDLVGGSSPEEVDASIEEMKARSEQIYANLQAAMQPAPFRGAAMPSVPPVGPMEQLPSYEQLTPEDIRAMDMDTYKRYRQQLLNATSPRQRGR